MGCDIHVRVQVKVRDEWSDSEYVQVDFDRNYALFAALADVRNYENLTPIFDARGLPDGIDEDFDYLGDHSYTWFTLEELIKWDGWDQKVSGDDKLRDWCSQFLCWPEYAESYFAYRLDETRLVVGFDS